MPTTFSSALRRTIFTLSKQKKKVSTSRSRQAPIPGRKVVLSKPKLCLRPQIGRGPSWPSGEQSSLYRSKKRRCLLHAPGKRQFQEGKSYCQNQNSAYDPNNPERRRAG